MTAQYGRSRATGYLVNPYLVPWFEDSNIAQISEVHGTSQLDDGF